jgi:hypothetical protein
VYRFIKLRKGRSTRYCHYLLLEAQGIVTPNCWPHNKKGLYAKKFQKIYYSPINRWWRRTHCEGGRECSGEVRAEVNARRWWGSGRSAFAPLSHFFRFWNGEMVQGERKGVQTGEIQLSLKIVISLISASSTAILEFLLKRP